MRGAWWLVWGVVGCSTGPAVFDGGTETAGVGTGGASATFADAGVTVTTGTGGGGMASASTAATGSSSSSATSTASSSSSATASSSSASSGSGGAPPECQGKPKGAVCLSACLCPPCSPPPVSDPSSCTAGRCDGGPVCNPAMQVKCKVNGVTYAGCGNLQGGAQILWDAGGGFGSGKCYPGDGAGYCAPGVACQADNKGLGVCL